MKLCSLDPSPKRSLRLLEGNKATFPTIPRVDMPAHAQPTTTTHSLPMASPRRPAPWPRKPELDELEPEQRGERAVLHGEATRGRRSTAFPDLNITATAKQLGVSKSHLAKVLAGFHRPSITLAIRLADVLGKDLMYVAALYKKGPKED